MRGINSGLMGHLAHMQTLPYLRCVEATTLTVQCLSIPVGLEQSNQKQDLPVLMSPKASCMTKNARAVGTGLPAQAMGTHPHSIRSCDISDLANENRGQGNISFYY